MTKQVLKSIATGLFLGAAFFIIPFFILKLLAFFIIITSVFKLMAWRMFRNFFGHWQRHAFADNIAGDYAQHGNSFSRNFRSRNASHEKKIIIIN